MNEKMDNTAAAIMNEKLSKFASILHPGESIGPGTIVTLKTSGPAMVVIERSADKVNVIWHDENGQLHETWLPIIAVKVKT